MTNDQLQGLIGQLLGGNSGQPGNPLLNLLGQLQQPAPVAVVEPASPQVTSKEFLLIQLLREFESETDEGKQLVSLLGKFQRYVQAKVDKS